MRELQPNKFDIVKADALAPADLIGDYGVNANCLYIPMCMDGNPFG